MRTRTKSTQCTNVHKQMYATPKKYRILYRMYKKKYAHIKRIRMKKSQGMYAHPESTQKRMSRKWTAEMYAHLKSMRRCTNPRKYTGNVPAQKSTNRMSNRKCTHTQKVHRKLTTEKDACPKWTIRTSRLKRTVEKYSRQKWLPESTRSKKHTQCTVTKYKRENGYRKCTHTEMEAEKLPTELSSRCTHTQCTQKWTNRHNVSTIRPPNGLFQIRDEEQDWDWTA